MGVGALIDAIWAIGDQYLASRGLRLEALVAPLPPKRRYALALDITLHPSRLRLEERQAGPEVVREWLWVGNAPGTTPQDRLTSNELRYLISQVIPNLAGGLPPGPAQSALTAVRDELCIDLRPRGGSDHRYRWVWDLGALGVSPAQWLTGLKKSDQERLRDFCRAWGVQWLSREFWQAYAREQGPEVAVKMAADLVHGYIQQAKGYRASEIALYTLKVDGRLLVRDPDYQRHLAGYFVDRAFESPVPGTCHLCGARGPVTADMTKFDLLKFYNKDKKGFACELDWRRGWYRNYALCRGCYECLLIGERFVRHQLRTTVGRESVFVVPTFHLSGLLRGDRLEGWAAYLKRRLNASATLESWKEFQGEVAAYQEHEAAKSGYVLNFLFAEMQNSAVKVSQLIQDVPPSRLDELDHAATKAQEVGDRILGELPPGVWWLGFRALYYLFPVRRVRRQPVAAPFLAFLDALLSGRQVNATQLMAQFVETAAIYRFGRFGAYVHSAPPPQRLHQETAAMVLRSNLLLRYLQKLGQLSDWTGGGPMAETPVPVPGLPEGVGAYFEELALAAPQRALFLLGYLVGEVAWVQGRWQSKPILDKVQFQGMDRDKVIRLSNDVYEKLRQYRLGDRDHETAYGAMKELLDRSLGQLGAPYENTYWVLSGYAFVTRRRSLRRAEAGEGRQAQAEALAPATEEPETDQEV
jgi:CRISPR-associated protein Csh1